MSSTGGESLDDRSQGDDGSLRNMVQELILESSEGHSFPGIEPLEIERLEYGKFCQSENGPIEALADHQQLGWSNGFPQELIPFCYPSKIGVISGSSDELPSGCQHGTVLRPVLLKSGKVLSVLYRFGKRSEGEGPMDRKYTVGRYLVAPRPDVDPLVLWQTMDSEPLRGITRREVEKMLPRMAPPPASMSLSNSKNLFKPLHSNDSAVRFTVTDRFLSKALVNLMSGVPVAIAGRVDEEVFFRWISTLWRLVHPSLRPFISAGWGVGSFLSGRLAVTYATSRAENCAVFSLPTVQSPNGEGDGGAWDPPKSILTSGKDEASSKYPPNREIPGEMYIHYFYESLPGYGQALTNVKAARDQRRARYFNLPLTVSDRFGHPDFIDRAVIDAFRDPGLDLFDLSRFCLVCAWLTNRDAGNHGSQRQIGSVDRDLPASNEEGNAPPLSDVKKLTKLHYMRKLLNVALNALGNEQSRRRGDQIVLTSLAPSRTSRQAFLVWAKDRIKGRRGRGADRARFFLALYERDPLESLQAMHAAVVVLEADDLPDRAVELFHRQLDSGLRATREEWLQANATFLVDHKDRLPKAYFEWLDADFHAFGLSARLSRLGASKNQKDPKPEKRERKAIDAICDLTGKKAVKVLQKFEDMVESWTRSQFEQKKRLTADDIAAIRATPQEDRDLFGEILADTWDHGDAGSRDDLIPWLQAFRPTLLQEAPLAALAMEPAAKARVETGKQFSRQKCDIIDEEVRADRVPETLLEPIAALYLLRFGWIGDSILQSPNTCSRITSQWPAVVLQALLRGAAKDTKKLNRSDLLSNAASNIEMTTDQAESLLRYWLSTNQLPGAAKKQMSANVAAYLWHCAGRCKGESRQGGSTSRIAVLCRYFQHQAIPIAETDEGDIEAALRLAKKAGVPQALEADAPKLWKKTTSGLMLRYYLSLCPQNDFEPSDEQQGELVRHRQWLRKYVKGNRAREQSFRDALLDPQARPYDTAEWRPGLQRTVLWFSRYGVPVEAQGSLRDALEAYCQDDDQRATECIRYLRSQTSPKERNQQASRVVREFLLHKYKAYELENRCYFVEKGMKRRRESAVMRQAKRSVKPLKWFAFIWAGLVLVIQGLDVLQFTLFFPLDWIAADLTPNQPTTWIALLVLPLILWMIEQAVAEQTTHSTVSMPQSERLLLEELISNHQKQISKALNRQWRQ